jgi:hypothetical protein
MMAPLTVNLRTFLVMSSVVNALTFDQLTTTENQDTTDASAPRSSSVGSRGTEPNSQVLPCLS